MLLEDLANGPGIIDGGLKRRQRRVIVVNANDERIEAAELAAGARLRLLGLKAALGLGVRKREEKHSEEQGRTASAAKWKRNTHQGLLALSQGEAERKPV
jgi:hypothetical protein